jgi:hypothetical protein
VRTLFITLSGVTTAVILLNILLLLAPLSRSELSIWRMLRVQRLRRYLTMLRKTDQPLSLKTTAIAKKNIVWHIVMTLAIFMVTVRTYLNQSQVFSFIMIFFCTITSIAWLLGSIVQRQKLAIIYFGRTKL